MLAHSLKPELWMFYERKEWAIKVTYNPGPPVKAANADRPFQR